MALRYVIIPSNEVTDEMKAASEIYVVSPDEGKTKTVFDFKKGKKPECYNGYTEYSKKEWYDIYATEFWSPVPEWI